MKFHEKKHDKITKENIEKMVVSFYTKILKADNEVSKVFSDKLGSNLKSETWKTHIQTLTKFWAMQTMGDMSYRGNPMAAHFDLPLSKIMFPLWLEMFFELIDSMYEPQIAYIFKNRSSNIATNFARNLGLNG